MGETACSSGIAPRSSGTSDPLRGARILIVEDEVLIAMEIEATLESAGAEVIGPAHTISQALSCIEQDGQISCAVLDLRLGRDDITPVARSLTVRGIPFVFYSGQTASDPICRQWPGVTFVAKPASGKALIAALAALCANTPN